MPQLVLRCVFSILSVYFFLLDISDLSLVITETGLKAQPLTADGFAFTWTGAKATYGVKSGKVCFETKVVYNMRQITIVESFVNINGIVQ